jgi:hypothetical protein
VLVACSGNSLEDFSGRELWVVMLPPTEPNPERYGFKAELVRRKAEVGCLRLHDDVKATINGQPLNVFRGTTTPDPDGPCGSPAVPPVFTTWVDAALFFEGEPRNAVVEIVDGDERIVAEYAHFFARHAFARPTSPLTAKPGQELFLAWDPPTDDLSIIEQVTVGDRRVPVRAEAGGLRLTLPADLPTGPVRVMSRASDIPAVRCEGVATCSAASMVIVGPSVEVDIQP